MILLNLAGSHHIYAWLIFILLLFLVVAFLVALHQNKELLGDNGLLPIPLYFNKLRGYFQVYKSKFIKS